jgi:hypothetical protein
MVSEGNDALPSAGPSISLSGSPCVYPGISQIKTVHPAREISAKKNQPAINSEANDALCSSNTLVELYWRPLYEVEKSNPLPSLA